MQYASRDSKARGSFAAIVKNARQFSGRLHTVRRPSYTACKDFDDADDDDDDDDGEAEGGNNDDDTDDHFRYTPRRQRRKGGFAPLSMESPELSGTPSKPAREATGPFTSSEAWEQLKVVVTLGLPNNVEKFSSFLPPFLMLMFMGSLGADEIAGAGMGFMFGNVSGVSMVVGFGLGLPPLASQAFGAGNFRRVGELLQRQLVLHLLVVVPPVALVWYNTEAILLAARQPPAIARLTAEFLRWRLPALPCLAVAETLTNYVKAQRVMVPSMALMVSVNALSVPLAWCLMYPAGLGFKGGPIALTVANVVQALALACLSWRWIPHREAWPSPWSIATALDFAGWRELLALSIPSAVMLWAEWWAWEMNLFLAGLLCQPSDDDHHRHDDAGIAFDGSSSSSSSSNDLGAWTNGTAPNGTLLLWNQSAASTNGTSPGPANSTSPEGAMGGSSSSGGGGGGDVASCVELDVFPIVSNTMVLAFFLHFGYSMGAATHIGNLMGAGKPRLARLAALVNCALVGCTSGAVAVCLITVRHRWGALFSDDPLVGRSVARVLPLVAAYIALDALGPGALNNILRALGVVRLPACLNVSAFYVVGIPTGLLLTFGPWFELDDGTEVGADQGIFGLWTGLVVGMAFMVAGLTFVFLRLDWSAIAVRARRQALTGQHQIQPWIQHGALTPAASSAADPPPTPPEAPPLFDGV